MGNRNLPLKYTKGLTFVEQTEMTGKDFLVICHSFRMEKSGFVFIPHLHKAFEILYVEQGYPSYTCNNKVYSCKPGDFMIFNSMDMHACLYAEAPYKSRCIQFEYDMLSSKFLDLCEKEYLHPFFTGKILCKNHLPYNAEFHGLFQTIETEYKQKKDGYELAVKGHLYTMLSWLYRNALEKHEIAASNMNVPLNQERFNRVVEYINENYTQDIRAETVAKILFVDKSYISRIFKSYSGKTITEYINTQRILVAITLLKETKMIVTQIALEVGFSDINYFSRLFKQIVGVSPKTFRQQTCCE
ncbi:MAG: AraC family transcriptional regulator [Clostridiales bacterium]|nr:AraC family transcriptional regulator [Clostridiales bacterium]